MLTLTFEKGILSVPLGAVVCLHPLAFSAFLAAVFAYQGDYDLCALMALLTVACAIVGDFKKIRWERL